MLLSGFLAAFAEAHQQEQPGAWSGAGSRPVPDVISRLRQLLVHNTAMVLPPTTRMQ